jgi:anti-anti-sigma factor
VALLNVVLVPGPDQVVVRLTGESDLSTAPLLADGLTRAASLGTPQIVVDVAPVRFWDVSGLHTLVAFTLELAAADRTCRIVGAPASTRRLIELADLAPELNLGGVVRELPNFVATSPRPPRPALRTGRSRRPVPAGAGNPHGAPVADGLAVPARN